MPCSEFVVHLYRNALITLEFTDPLLLGLYTHECAPSRRFQCSSPTRRRFVLAITELLVAKTVHDILDVMFLDGRVIDSGSRTLSVKVDNIYRLDLSYKEEHGMLTGITIHRLRKI